MPTDLLVENLNPAWEEKRKSSPLCTCTRWHARAMIDWCWVTVAVLWRVVCNFCGSSLASSGTSNGHLFKALYVNLLTTRILVHLQFANSTCIQLVSISHPLFEEAEQVYFWSQMLMVSSYLWPHQLFVHGSIWDGSEHISKNESTLPPSVFEILLKLTVARASNWLLNYLMYNHL